MFCLCSQLGRRRWMEWSAHIHIYLCFDNFQGQSSFFNEIFLENINRYIQNLVSYVTLNPINWKGLSRHAHVREWKKEMEKGRGIILNFKIFAAYPAYTLARIRTLMQKRTKKNKWKQNKMQTNKQTKRGKMEPEKKTIKWDKNMIITIYASSSTFVGITRFLAGLESHLTSSATGTHQFQLP